MNAIRNFLADLAELARLGRLADWIRPNKNGGPADPVK